MSFSWHSSSLIWRWRAKKARGVAETWSSQRLLPPLSRATPSSQKFSEAVRSFSAPHVKNCWHFSRVSAAEVHPHLVCAVCRVPLQQRMYHKMLVSLTCWADM